jgi:hypothetical protein
MAGLSPGGREIESVSLQRRVREVRCDRSDGREQGFGRSKNSPPWDQQFESSFLQGGVMCELGSSISRRSLEATRSGHRSERRSGRGSGSGSGGAASLLRGTESSNPLPSTGESSANLTSGAHPIDNRLAPNVRRPGTLGSDRRPTPDAALPVAGARGRSTVSEIRISRWAVRPIRRHPPSSGTMAPSAEHSGI